MSLPQEKKKPKKEGGPGGSPPGKGGGPPRVRAVEQDEDPAILKGVLTGKQLQKEKKYKKRSSESKKEESREGNEEDKSTLRTWRRLGKGDKIDTKLRDHKKKRVWQHLDICLFNLVRLQEREGGGGARTKRHDEKKQTSGGKKKRN